MKIESIDDEEEDEDEGMEEVSYHQYLFTSPSTQNTYIADRFSLMLVLAQPSMSTMRLMLPWKTLAHNPPV